MIITSFFLKGGVGKTTIISNLAVHLAKNKKVCIIDLDSQSNIASSFGFFGDALKCTLIEYLKDASISLNQLMITINDHLKIIPSNSDLIGFDDLKANQKQRINTLIQNLEKQFDVILIDTPPAFNTLTSLFLSKTDMSISIFECETYAFSGLCNTIKIINQFSNLKKSFFIANKFIRNSKNQVQALAQFKEYINEQKNKKFKMLELPIARSIQSANAVYNERVPILWSKAKSKMRSEIEELCSQIK